MKFQILTLMLCLSTSLAFADKCVTSGATTICYDNQGRTIGKAVQNGNKTTYYDADGGYAGS